MAARPQADIDAEAWEARQMDEMEKKGGAGAEFVAAVRAARRARTEAGLDCDYTDEGEAKFTIQQGLKAAAHAREDAAAILILQVKIIQRLDRLQNMLLVAVGVLVVLAFKILG